MLNWIKTLFTGSKNPTPTADMDEIAAFFKDPESIKTTPLPLVAANDDEKPTKKKATAKPKATATKKAAPKTASKKPAAIKATEPKKRGRKPKKA